MTNSNRSQLNCQHRWARHNFVFETTPEFRCRASSAFGMFTRLWQVHQILNSERVFCFRAAARSLRQVLACIMQVSPLSEEKEVPGKDRWKFFHIVELVMVSGSSLHGNAFKCNSVSAQSVFVRRAIELASQWFLWQNLELSANNTLLLTNEPLLLTKAKFISIWKR